MAGITYERDLRLRELRTLVQYHGDAAHVHKISNRRIKNLLDAKQLNNPKTPIFGHSFGHVVGSPRENFGRHYVPPIKSKFLSLDDMYIITDHALRSARAVEAMEALGCYALLQSIVLLIPMKDLDLPKKFHALSFDTVTNQPIGEKWEIEYVFMKLKPYFYEYYIPVDNTDNDLGNGAIASVGLNTMYPLNAVDSINVDEKMEIKTVEEKVKWARRKEVFHTMELRSNMVRSFFVNDY